MTGGLDPRLNACRPDLADARLEGRVEAARFVAGEARRVAAATAPLRRQPRPDAALDTEALFGETVRVFEKTGDGWAWAQLDTDGYVGWMPASALAPPGAPATHRVRALRTYAFPGPDVHLPPTALLSMNARLRVGGHTETFAETDAGFVFAEHLAPLDGAAEPDFVAVAARFLGTPYLWGGRTSVGLDCSGLVQVALAAAGVAVRRDSDMQADSAGTPVDHADLAALRRGDLLFWRGHVGIHHGDGMLLHATGRFMETVLEPLGDAVARIAARGLPVTGARRIDSVA